MKTKAGRYVIQSEGSIPICMPFAFIDRGLESLSGPAQPVLPAIGRHFGAPCARAETHLLTAAQPDHFLFDDLVLRVQTFRSGFGPATNCPHSAHLEDFAGMTLAGLAFALAGGAPDGRSFSPVKADGGFGRILFGMIVALLPITSDWQIP